MQVCIDGAVHDVCNFLQGEPVEGGSPLRNFIFEAEGEVLQIHPQTLTTASPTYLTGNVLWSYSTLNTRNSIGGSSLAKLLRTNYSSRLAWVSWVEERGRSMTAT